MGNEFFRTNGYWVARELLSQTEVTTLRAGADRVASDLENYRRVDDATREEQLQRFPGHVTSVPATGRDFSDQPPRSISDRHLRRGDRIYPARLKALDHAAIEAGNASGDPYSHARASSDLAQVSHLVDHDEVFAEFAAHPAILKVLEELLSPNLKVWFDHIFSKPPYNDIPPYGGANRYHQDGFFHLSRRSVTIWVALDDINTDQGCLRFIPLTSKYGQFEFDALGDAISTSMLKNEVLVPMAAGDVSFHDRWVVHGTGPNESDRRRRAWAVHYADAQSQFGNYGGESARPLPFFQRTDGVHIRNGIIHGNLDWPLVHGNQFVGCI